VPSIDMFGVAIRVIPMMLLLFGFMVGIQFLGLLLERKLKLKHGETSRARIDRLSKALNESIELTSEIENEIRSRHKVVEKLKEDVERYEELSSIKASEIEAVAQTIRGEIKRESNKSLLKSTIVNFLFFIAGIIITLYVA